MNELHEMILSMLNQQFTLSKLIPKLIHLKLLKMGVTFTDEQLKTFYADLEKQLDNIALENLSNEALKEKLEGLEIYIPIQLSTPLQLDEGDIATFEEALQKFLDNIEEVWRRIIDKAANELLASWLAEKYQKSFK